MTYLKKGLLALLMILPLACKKPTDNIKIVVDTNIIKYTALIDVMDASSGGVPPGATISIGGSAASNIYEVSGKKIFTVVNGSITLGLGPSVAPTAGNPISFTVTTNASGYNPITQTITFTAGQMQQVVLVHLSRTAASTATTTSADGPTTSTGTTGSGTTAPVTNPAVSLNFTGTCANNSNIIIKPSLYVFYRVSGSGKAYQYLGYMNSGQITTTALAQGTSYDFQINYGGQNYTANQLIQQTNYSLTIDMGSACNNF